MDNLFTNALRQLLKDQCTPHLIREIESGTSPKHLWQQLQESGFADALLSEAQGGADLKLIDAFPLMELCGTYALPVSLAETMFARALLAGDGIKLPEGSITLAFNSQQIDGSLVCKHVPYGRVANWVLLDQGDFCLLLPAASANIQADVFALDAVLTWSANAVQEAQRLAGRHDLRTLLACIVATQLSGTLMGVFTRTLQFANDRNQFGRPIGKFQNLIGTPS
jgi:acyl-CoA dehydrogenase